MASAVISRSALAKHLRPVVEMSPSVPPAAPCVGYLVPVLVNLGSALTLKPILQLVSRLFAVTSPDSDIYTGGGCLEACPFGNAPVTGVNCKEIKGVNPNTVTCGDGRCIVKDCAEGFFVAPSGDKCIPVPKYATPGSKQQSGAPIAGPSGSAGGIEGLKVSRDALIAALKHGAGIAIAPFGGPVGGSKTPRDATGGIQHGTSVVPKPILGATKHLTAGGSAGPAGVVAGVVQGAKVVSPVAGAVEGTSAGFKATRDVGLPHGPGVAPIGGAAAGHIGGFPGIHGIRGVEGA